MNNLVPHLPAINACLNALACALLLAGWRMIRKRKVEAHKRCMLAAFATSAVFLVGYLIHKRYAGEQSTAAMTWLPGWLRAVYLAILFPHLLLAVVMLPFIGMTLWRAFGGDFERHKKIARPTLLIWLFVSVGGVIIYAMLYHLFPALR